MIRLVKKHYHWIIALLVFLEMIVYGGLINSASVFVKPISETFGVPTTAYSVAMMPYTITCFAGTCLSGFFFARIGYKKTAMISLTLIASSLVLTGFSQNLIVFCISKILFGMGYAACFTAGAVYIIKCWFWKHQGLVLGAVNMATGLGGSLMTIVLSSTIKNADWRVANFVAAAIVAVIAALYLLIKDRPEKMNLRPFGSGAPIQTKKKAKVTDQSYPGYPFRQQLKRPMFYMMCVAVLVSCICLYMLSGFVVPHFMSIGFSESKAAAYQSIYMLVLAIVKLGIGFFYDRFGAKPVMVGCMFCAVVGQGILGVSTDPILTLIGLLLFSAGLCMSSIMVPLIAAPLFGYKACLSVNGIFLGLSSFASLFSSPLASLCFDIRSNYMLAHQIAAVVNIGVFGLYMILFAMAKRDRIRYAREHADEE